VDLPNYNVQEFAPTKFTKGLLEEYMDKNVPCKNFYQTTFFWLKTRSMGQICGVATPSSAITKHRIISEQMRLSFDSVNFTACQEILW
jgi:hypothetical protein